MQSHGSFTFKTEHMWETLNKRVFLENVIVNKFKNQFFAHDISSLKLMNVSSNSA